jgi:hypothetical protein
VDDAILSSEIALALYILPGMCGGMGINVLSHNLVRHLVDTKRKFRDEQSGQNGSPRVATEPADAGSGVSNKGLG